jgi:integrase
MAKAQVEADAPTTVNSSVRKTRKYLTPAEVERLMAAARKSGPLRTSRRDHDPDRVPARTAGVRAV